MSTMSTTRTSRIGRKPITVPSGVEVKVQNEKLTVKGPKGQLATNLHAYVNVTVDAGKVSVKVADKTGQKITGLGRKTLSAIPGTTRANIANMIVGVTTGFERKLTLIGVGYRAASKGKILSLSLGFSHPTDYTLPEGVTAETPTQTEIILKGANKEAVGQAAAEIRAIRSPEPYKGKGVRYADEVVELKETKKK